MRIVMIGQKGIPSLYGGIERHVEDLSLELTRQGHEVFVYARKWYTPKNLKNYRGVRIIHTPSIHSKNLDAITHTFTATIHALFQKPDVIHYHGVGPSLLSWIPRIFSRRIKVISTFHCIDRYHQKWGRFARFMLHLGERASCLFAHETIAVSKTIQSYCQNEFQKSTTYIPNGVNAVENQYGDSLLYQWGLTKDRYIVMVARLVRHKGAHYLINAWQIARQQCPELLRSYKLVIVGDSTFTDDYVSELKEMARGDKSIVFTGWQHGQALQQLFSNAAMLVHPSENEGLSLSVLNAMSKAKPVLISDIPENKELVCDQRFWFYNTNVTSLAYKIAELLQHPEWMAEAGTTNYNTVKNGYSWKNIAKDTSELYNKKYKAEEAKQLQIADA